jgi:hypothetical protein
MVIAIAARAARAMLEGLRGIVSPVLIGAE